MPVRRRTSNRGATPGRECIKDERMPDKELVKKLLNDWLVGLCPTPPVDMTQRVARTIFAQGNELFRLAHRGRQCHATGLILNRPGEAKRRNRKAPWQDENRLWRQHAGPGAKEPESIGPRDADLCEGKRPPDLRQQRVVEYNHRPGSNARDFERRLIESGIFAQQPTPAIMAPQPIKPIPLLLTRFGSVEELVEGRPRIGQDFTHVQFAMFPAGVILKAECVREWNSHRAKARQ